MDRDRKTYYSGQMQRLAELWEGYGAYFPKADPNPLLALKDQDLSEVRDSGPFLKALYARTDPHLVDLVTACQRTTDRLFEEFNKEVGGGPGLSLWNDLMEESGARARIDAALLASDPAPFD